MQLRNLFKGWRLAERARSWRESVRLQVQSDVIERLESEVRRLEVELKIAYAERDVAQKEQEFLGTALESRRQAYEADIAKHAMTIASMGQIPQQQRRSR